MTAKQILAELKPQGSEGYVRILRNHGVTGPVYGVKIEYMKKIVKREKKNYQLALDLYDTGVYDAMYLAGLIADETKMTKKDLNHWLANSNSDMLCGYTVPWVASESKHGRELGLEWIESKKPGVAAAGWSTLGCLVAVKDNADLNILELKKLLQRVQNTIHDQPDRVRASMNHFVIALGIYVKPLGDAAIACAEKIGKVKVDVGDTNCKIPFAPEYIQKGIKRNPTGKKRETARC